MLRSMERPFPATPGLLQRAVCTRLMARPPSAPFATLGHTLGATLRCAPGQALRAWSCARRSGFVASWRGHIILRSMERPFPATPGLLRRAMCSALWSGSYRRAMCSALRREDPGIKLSLMLIEAPPQTSLLSSRVLSIFK